MAISLASLRRSDKPRPPIIVEYGPHGVGKTSLASQAPSPVFIQTEDGLGMLDTQTFGLLATFDEVSQAIGALYTEDHEHKTLVIDSLDHLEPMIWTDVCQKNGWKSVEDPGYGKGYIAALDVWRKFLDGLRALRDERNMTIIMIAHAEIKRFDSPETEPYDRYSIKLHARASALVQETADCVFFANYRISTVKSDAGFGRKITRAVGGGDRFLNTTERPSFLAKNRFAMPDQIPMDWDAVAAAIPYFNKQNEA